MCAKVKDIAVCSRSVPIPKLAIGNPVIKNAYLALIEESMYYPIQGDPSKHKVKDIVKKTLEFVAINEIAVSMSFYLIIETADLKDNSVEASIIDQNDEVLFKEKLDLNTSKSQSRKLYGSYWGKDKDGNKAVLWQKTNVKLFDYIDNKDDFKEIIIKKINLPIGEKSSNDDELRKKIYGTSNKLLNLVLKIDAHTPNKKYKGKEDRIKYLGIKDPRKKDNSEFNNYFIYNDKEYYQLKAWRGIVVHSMGDIIIDKGKEVNHKDFIISKGLSVHAYVRQNGEIEKHQDLFKTAAHAGESYDAGVSGLNQSYLGFELTVDDATDIEKLHVICNQQGKVKNEEIIECENKIEQLDRDIANKIAESKANHKKLSIVNANNKLISRWSKEKSKLEKRINLLELNPSVYPDIQVNSAIKLTKEWIKEFNINPKYVVRHSDISGDNIKHGPKFDPGINFKWDDFKKEIIPKSKSNIDLAAGIKLNSISSINHFE